MVNTVGFIGLGNMGSALISSVLKQEVKIFDTIYVYDLLSEKLSQFSQNEDIETCNDLEKLVVKSNFIVLAVKPQSMQNLLISIKNFDLKDKIFITIAAGLKISFYQNILGNNISITRVMPNTPYLVGEGAAGIVYDTNLSEEHKIIVKNLFEFGGKVISCEEKLIDVVTGLSGSGPAYIFMIIEALADGAVKMGLGRSQAYKLAAQTVLGSAKMVLETGKHPGELKDMVASPGGTTIEAISVLEKHKIRSALIEAVVAATKKSQSFH
jgi:pyrroline-5-carboxylate reductase